MTLPAVGSVFQMRLSLTTDNRVGWLLADEAIEESETQSFSYVIPWKPDVPFEGLKFTMAGCRKGHLFDFSLEFNGSVFVEPANGLRFALNDPMSPQDFRGLPFLRAFPYVGKRSDVLAWYGVTEFFAFLPLIPLDLIKMDQLYMENGFEYVGVTTRFGAHARPATRKVSLSKAKSGRSKAEPRKNEEISRLA